MKTFYKSLLFFLISLSLAAQGGIDYSGFSTADNVVIDFMNQYNIPGLTMAISKDGELKYMKAFGEADPGKDITMRPYHKLRVGSISKTITALGIFKLIEAGELSLNDKVFGPEGILANEFNDVSIADSRTSSITVQNLLEHTAGWDSSVNCFPNPTSPYPFFFPGCEPAMASLYVGAKYDTSYPVPAEVLIQFLLERDLDVSPGEEYAYSNIGYLVLGQIIEAISGKGYEVFIKDEILHPLGIYDTHLGNTLKEDALEREGAYVGRVPFTILSVYGNGNYVDWEYGGFSLEETASSGGWISTSRDLVKLLAAVDGFDTKPELLSSASLEAMVAPSTVNSTVAKGWSVDGSGNRWHIGSIPGTSSIFFSGSNGYNYAIIINTRPEENIDIYNLDLLTVGTEVVDAITDWPSWDLMEMPKVNASNITISALTDGQTKVDWTPGDGDKRMLVVRKASTDAQFPLDGVDYAASANLGEELDTGNYIVYNGTGSSVTIDGLESNTEYVFRVIEFNNAATTGNNPIYQLGENAQKSFTTGNLSTKSDVEGFTLSIYPQPAENSVFLKWNGSEQQVEYSIYSLTGSNCASGTLSQERGAIEIANLESGIYFIKIENQAFQTIRKLLVK